MTPVRSCKFIIISEKKLFQYSMLRSVLSPIIFFGLLNFWKCSECFKQTVSTGSVQFIYVA